MVGSNTTAFKIQDFEKGHSHDDDLELRAFDSQNNPITNLYQCMDKATPGASVYSTPIMPEGCAGGSMNMMVTQIL